MLKDSRITARNTRLEPPNEMENSIRIIGTTGRINLKDTTLIAYNTFPRKCEVVVNHNATLNVEGGVHKGLDIVTHKGFTIDRRFDNPFTINIRGNINSYMLSITHGNCLGETMLNYRRHNMTLEGDWSAYGVNLWGNLGINMTAPAYKEASASDKERVPDWFNDNTPAVVMRSVNVAFNLEEIVTAGSAGNRQDVFEAAHKLAVQVINSGATIHRFCALMDIHKDASCRCGLYYSLLLLLDPLAIAYYIRHTPALAHLMGATLADIPTGMIEDVLQERLFALVPHSDAYENAVDKVRHASTPRFKAALKKQGVENINLLWSTNPEGGQWFLDRLPPRGLSYHD